MHCNEKTKQNKKLKSQNMGCAKPFGTTKWQYTAGDRCSYLGAELSPLWHKSPHQPSFYRLRLARDWQLPIGEEPKGFLLARLRFFNKILLALSSTHFCDGFSEGARSKILYWVRILSERFFKWFQSMNESSYCSVSLLFIGMVSFVLNFSHYHRYVGTAYWFY